MPAAQHRNLPLLQFPPPLNTHSYTNCNLYANHNPENNPYSYTRII